MKYNRNEQYHCKQTRNQFVADGAIGSRPQYRYHTKKGELIMRELITKAFSRVTPGRTAGRTAWALRNTGVRGPPLHQSKKKI